MSEDTPLRFAKEILGWPEACRHKGERWAHSKVYSGPGYDAKTFRYNDRKQFEGIVKAWADKNNIPISLHYSPFTKSYVASCAGALASDAKPHIAIMRAILSVGAK